MPQPINVNRTGTGWTLDVTTLQLGSSLTTKDFLVFHNGVKQPLTAYTKTTPTLLTYGGVALAANTPIQVYRDTPATTTPLLFGEINTTAGLNSRFAELARTLEDIRILLEPKL